MDRHIILRPFNIEKDLPFFHRLHSDANSMKYYGMHEFKSIDDSRKLMMDYIESEKNNKSVHRVICDMQHNEYMGEIGLFNIHPVHHRANAYCILMPEHRKRGVSIEASTLFYKEAFEVMQINRVQALVDSRNVNATNSLKGIGFIFEGKLQQYEYEEDGYIDIEVYSLIKSRFYELYAK